MISLSKYYHFKAEEVEYVEVAKSEEATYPYRLSVHLKSGNIASVNYQNETDRNRARDELVRGIDRERREDDEKISNALRLLQNISSTIGTIDRRQLRIWRQLRDLLGLKIEED